MKHIRLLIIAALCVHGMVHTAGKSTGAVLSVEQAEQQYAQLIKDPKGNEVKIRSLIEQVRTIPGVRSAVWAKNKAEELDARLNPKPVSTQKNAQAVTQPEQETKMAATQPKSVQQRAAAFGPQIRTTPASKPAQPSQQKPKQAPIGKQSPIIQQVPPKPTQQKQAEVKKVAAVQAAQQVAQYEQKSLVQQRLAALGQTKAQQGARAQASKPTVQLQSQEDVEGMELIEEFNDIRPTESLFNLIDPLFATSPSSLHYFVELQQIFANREEAGKALFLYQNTLFKLDRKTKIELIKKALENGADVNEILPHDINSALYPSTQISKHWKSPEHETLLRSAIIAALLRSDLEIAELLLKARGNSNTDFYSALDIIPTLVASTDQPLTEKTIIQEIELLCRYVTDQGTKNRALLNALERAYEYPNIIRALLRCGANPYEKKAFAYVDKTFVVNAFQMAEENAKISGDDRTLKVLQEWKKEEQAKIAREVQQPPRIKTQLPRGVAAIIAEYAEGPIEAAPAPAPTSQTESKAAASTALVGEDVD